MTPAISKATCDSVSSCDSIPQTNALEHNESDDDTRIEDEVINTPVEIPRTSDIVQPKYNQKSKKNGFKLFKRRKDNDCSIM